MSRNQFLLILLSVIVASMMGGAISSWFFLSAKKTEEQVPAQIVRAQRFEVIDERGKTLGVCRTWCIQLLSSRYFKFVNMLFLLKKS